MKDDENHSRSVELGRDIRSILLKLYTGAFGAIFAVAIGLVPQGISPDWTWPSLSILLLGLIVTILGYFSAKHKLLNPDKRWIKNQTVQFWSLGIFSVAAIVGFYSFNTIKIRNGDSDGRAVQAVSESEETAMTPIVVTRGDVYEIIGLILTVILIGVVWFQFRAAITALKYDAMARVQGIVSMGPFLDARTKIFKKWDAGEKWRQEWAQGDKEAATEVARRLNEIGTLIRMKAAPRSECRRHLSPMFQKSWFVLERLVENERATSPNKWADFQWTAKKFWDKSLKPPNGAA